MKAWIEVSSDYRFDKKLSGESGLTAPATNRYINMMDGVTKDDIILHYIIKQGATKEHESRILAVSIAKSVMHEEPPRIVVDLKEIAILPIPVTLKEVKEIKNKSENLKKLIRMSFLRYLTEISKEDLMKILMINSENIQYLNSLNSYKKLLEN